MSKSAATSGMQQAPNSGRSASVVVSHGATAAVLTSVVFTAPETLSMKVPKIGVGPQLVN